MTRSGEVSKIITDLAHGGHAIADNASNAQTLKDEGWTLLSEVVQAPEAAAGSHTGYHVGTTDFDYLFKNLVNDPGAHLPAGNDVQRVNDALNKLGEAMVDDPTPPEAQVSKIPPIYTYWGQFVDHDITAATDNDKPITIRDVPVVPLEPGQVTHLLKNARNPALNLDPVYGNGPFAPVPTDPDEIFVDYQETDRAKLKLGPLSDIGGLIPPFEDMERDLPRREDRTPLIGDRRNDENLIVAQLHVAFLKFHNRTVDWVRANEPHHIGVADVFRRARDLTRWTYQWLCVHDFLPTVALPDTVDSVLTDEGPGLLGRPDLTMPFIPLEFAVAAYRFGHSMIRGAYDWNRNFGQPDQANATLEQMFQFTGRGGFRGLTTLPSNWPAEWDRFVDKTSAFPERFARPIDTHLAPPLAGMVNQAGPPAVPDDIAKLLKHLARRNLLRGYRLSLPTGQAVAAELGLPVLTPQEITDGAGTDALAALTTGGFAERTPLWYYVLRESELRTQGNSLGPVGSRIVAETLIAQLRYDKTSFVHQGGNSNHATWSPHDGVRLPDGARVDSIRNFLRFAGVL